ncbi:MAG: S1 RNA-binding domain-containing protein [Polyangiaceae bacterium]|jgi:small subunit ribosomal protein S1|nr:S1 RNA-binding domain-containing protein [Polyangiaceae bacterium]MBK8936306.1 S1 RNA-binding domain-containing protein [Polyangiaceae bacterium]
MSSDRKGSEESFAALFESAQVGATRPRRLHRGDRLDVKVVAIGRDAVFVDLGGKQEGYFDSSEALDKNGNVAVAIGATVQAIVTEADGERVKLSPVFVRATDTPPAEGFEGVSIPRAKSGPLLVAGAHVRGTVASVERYGVFVQIVGTQGRHGRGLVPTAETNTPRGADLRKQFPVGTEVEAKILAIADDGKIRLSFKAMSEDAERSEFEAYRDGQKEPADGATAAALKGKDDKAAPRAPRPPPAPRNFGTLGDLLAKRKG